MFNPKIEKFLKENKNITILGLWWAMVWRMYVTVFGLYIAFALLFGILAALA